MDVTRSQATPLGRLKRLGLIKSAEQHGRVVTVVTAAGETVAMASVEAEAYCRGMAHGAWVVQSGSARLPTRSAS